MQAVRQAREQLMVEGPFRNLLGQHQSQLPLEQERSARHNQQQREHRDQRAEAGAAWPAPSQACYGHQQCGNQHQFEHQCVHAFAGWPIQKQVQKAAENNKAEKSGWYRQPADRGADSANQSDEGHTEEQPAEVPTQCAESGITAG